MSLTSHPYKTRSQTSDGSSDTSGATVSVATSENITNLETKLLSRFDKLTKELLNVKGVIIKNLQAENERLREKVNNLESKVTSKSTKTNFSSTVEETILKYLVFPIQLKITTSKKKLFLCLPVLVRT